MHVLAVCLACLPVAEEARYFRYFINDQKVMMLTHMYTLAQQQQVHYTNTIHSDTHARARAVRIENETYKERCN